MYSLNCSFLQFFNLDWLRPQRTLKDAKAEDNKDSKIEELTAKVKMLVNYLLNSYVNNLGVIDYGVIICLYKKIDKNSSCFYKIICK